MRILYYSVHHILEDDEVRLFHSLGHEVCCLGVNGADGASQSYRDPIPFGASELALYAAFSEMGGVFVLGSDVNTFCIPPAFVDLFDVVIVMHDADFIAAHWSALSRRPVVWRGIGLGQHLIDETLRPFREQGLHIVRYTPIEMAEPANLEADACIRFYKDPEIYGKWNGEATSVLTFSNSYRARFPADAADFERIATQVAVTLGGVGNSGMPGEIGLVPPEEQVVLYKRARAYLYAHGLFIPYTLNFIEAWMTGTPMVVLVPPERRGAFLEVDRLITDGSDGYVCPDVETAMARLQALMSDSALAARIGAAGRDRAKSLFGIDVIRRQWADFLDTLRVR